MTNLTRALILIILVIGAMLLINAAVENPGNVTIDWYGYHIETTATFAVAVANILMIIGFYFGQLIGALLALPFKMKMLRHMRKDKNSMRALVDAISARVAGQKNSEKVATQVQKAIPDVQVGKVVASLVSPTETRLHSLLEDKQTAFIGLAGLVETAMAKRDWETAEEQARAALAKNPKAIAVRRKLVDAMLYQHNWMNAVPEIKVLRKHSEDDRLLNLEAAAWLQAALDVQGIAPTETVVRAQRARKVVPDYVPAVVAQASALAEQGQYAPAEKTLSQFFKKTPRYDVFVRWLNAMLHTTQKPEARQKRIDSLLEHLTVQPQWAALVQLCKATAHFHLEQRVQARQGVEKLLQQHDVAEAYLLAARMAETPQEAELLQRRAKQATPVRQMGEETIQAYQDFRRQYLGEKDARKLAAFPLMIQPQLENPMASAVGISVAKPA